MKKFAYLKTMNKAELALWTAIRLALIIWCFYEMFFGEVTLCLEALFSFIFTFLWDFFQFFGQKSFISKVNVHAQTLLNVFILFGALIGTKTHLFHDTAWYDVMLHFLSGAMSAWFGYDFAVVMQGKKKPLSPALATLFALGCAFTIAVGWEFYEFSMDSLHGTYLQCNDPNSNSGLIDTMTDLIACAIGTVPTAIITAFQRNGYIGRNRKARKARIAEENAKWEKAYEIYESLEK